MSSSSSVANMDVNGILSNATPSSLDYSLVHVIRSEKLTTSHFFEIHVFKLLYYRSNVIKP